MELVSFSACCARVLLLARPVPEHLKQKSGSIIQVRWAGWGVDDVVAFTHKPTPGKRPTWNLKMDLWKTIFLYNPVVFRFHVNLQGCRQALFSPHVDSM